MSLFADGQQEHRAGGIAALNGNGATNGNGAQNGNGTQNGNGAHSGSASALGGFAGSTPTMYAEYAGALQRTLNRMPWNAVHSVVQAIVKTWQQGGQILLMGNGGSASTATHLACDLSKNTQQPGLPRVRSIALNDNIALMTAYANDVGYDAVFSEQLRALAQPNDLVIAITTSGNSPNVLRAVEVARTLGLHTIALCGYTGGKVSTMVDLAVIAPNHCVEQIEDIHMVLAHVVTVGVRSAMQAALVAGAEFENGVLRAETAPALASFAGNATGAPIPSANGARSNGNHATGFVQPPTASYWQHGLTSLNGHD
jgi:D-sedoheptulose 7-phosphate isomerase